MHPNPICLSTYIHFHTNYRSRHILPSTLAPLAGLHKFYAVDASWSEWQRGTYLHTFYAWQPMPTPLARLIHHAGEHFHALSTHVVRISQLFAPFCMFGPRPLRSAAAALLVADQAWIQLNGNFGVFNILSAILCTCPLLDDWALSPPICCRHRCHLATTGAADHQRPRRLERVLLSFAALLNIIGGCFFLCRRLLLGLTPTSDVRLDSRRFPFLSIPRWLCSDAEAIDALDDPTRRAIGLATGVTIGEATYKASWRRGPVCAVCSV